MSQASVNQWVLERPAGGSLPLVTVTWGPLPLEAAVEAVTGGKHCFLPAKAFLRPRAGAGMLIELPADEHRAVTERRVNLAEAALSAWLSADGRPLLAQADPLPVTSNQIADAISALGWQGRLIDEKNREVIPATGLSCRRLFLRQTELGHLRVSLATKSVSIDSQHCARAITLFALESNWRLRMTRLSVAFPQSQAACLTLDLVLAGGSPLDHWLAGAAETLVACAEMTERSVRALANDAVAATFLRGRDCLPSRELQTVRRPAPA